MPKYRKLHVKATESEDINEMPDDFTRLLWVMLPLGLDREGRGLDNSAWIKSRIFPIRLDVTSKMIEAAMCWYADREMVLRYSVDGRHYFCVPTFGVYQGDTSKETPSLYPPPPEDNETSTPLLPNSEPTPELVQSKLPSDANADADSNTDISPPSVPLPTNAALPTEKAAAPLPLTAGQKKFLEYFGAKRFKTNIQRETVGELEKKYGTDLLIRAVEWQAKQGMNIGHAVTSLETAIKTFSKGPRAAPASPQQEADVPMPNVICGDGDRLRRRAIAASGQRNYQALLQDYLAHLRSCRICSGGSNSNEIQTQISQLAGKMSAPPARGSPASAQKPPQTR